LGVPIENQDDDAEDVLSSRERLMLLTKRTLKRPMVVLAIMVVITLVLASVLLSILGQSPYYEDDTLPRTVVRIRDLQVFENTHTYEYYIEEQVEHQNEFDFFHALQLPQETNAIIICLIDTVRVAITWQDEPDESGVMLTYQNQPDTVRASMADYNHVYFREEEASNDHGQFGHLLLEWRGDGEYIEQSTRRVDDTTWVWVAGENYITVKGGDVHWSDYMTSSLLIVEAGDHTHEVLPTGVQDPGNILRFEITLGGRYLSLPPGTYSDRSDR
jgi:hypothetical protein